MAHHLDTPTTTALASLVSFFIPPVVFGGVSYITNSWSGTDRRKRLIRFAVTITALLAFILYFDAKVCVVCSYWSLFAYTLCTIAKEKNET